MFPAKTLLFEAALAWDLGLPIATEGQRAGGRGALEKLDMAADGLVLKSFPMLRSPPSSYRASTP